MEDTNIGHLSGLRLHTATCNYLSATLTYPEHLGPPQPVAVQLYVFRISLLIFWGPICF